MRSKIVWICLLALCLVAGAQAEDAPGGYAYATVTLPGNATTGYIWTCDIEGADVLTLHSDEYRLDAAEDGASGTPGVQVFTLAGAGQGSATAIFTHAQPWDGGEAGDVAAYRFTVDERAHIIEAALLPDDTTLADAPAPILAYGPSRVTVRLPGNATTGYTWTYTGDNEEPLVEVSENYLLEGGEMAGAGGVFEWTFDSVHEGDVALTFQYAQAWDPAESADSAVFHFHVDAHGVISEISVEGTLEDGVPVPVYSFR